MSTHNSQHAPVQLTLLSSIPGGNFPLALERQRALGLRFLDLKDALWGKTIERFTEEEALRATELIEEFGLRIHCFSTSIGHTSLHSGTTESSFRAPYEDALANTLLVAKIMRPQVIRLLAPRLSPKCAGECAVARMARLFPWTTGVYRDWVDAIEATGFGVLIENEAVGCCLGSVDDVLLFFQLLDRPAARFTWDVQNLWQNGTFPSLDIYRQLKPLIGALHLKGGRSGDDGQTLKWAAPLEEASWPVWEIVRAVVADGTAPFICLNPSHGEKPDDWDSWEVARREVAWLRREIKGIA